MQNQENNTGSPVAVPITKKPFCIGVIINETNAEDVAYYNDEFRQINKMYKDKVKLLFLGYKPDSDKHDILNGVDYEYVKPVSIIHYFKQVKACEINLLFIPIIPNTYNVTSENYNKYLEASLLSIPIITEGIYPYMKLITNDSNGFVYKGKQEFIKMLEFILSRPKGISLIRECGKKANSMVMNEFNYSKGNMESLLNTLQ